MAVSDTHQQIFRRGSKTYFNTSLFFPREIRRRVFHLYGFVRAADDLVDSVPQDAQGFYHFCNAYRQSREGFPAGNPLIDCFTDLEREMGFPASWTEAFLHSMGLDLSKGEYNTLDETLEYIYGSAEVIGFFMARILNLPDKAMEAAGRQGRAMQYINFIRDIREDNLLGRRYLPLEDSPLPDLSAGAAEKNPEAFRRFHQKQVGRYRRWQEEADAGFPLIPRRYRIPVRTAADMYLWTAKQIEKDPFRVFREQVKPSRLRILTVLLGRAIRC